MSGLPGLTNELLFRIADYLATQKDISSLVRVNKDLYHRLKPFLYEFNIKHHRGSALMHAVRKGDVGLTRHLLDAGASVAAFEPTYAELGSNENYQLCAFNGTRPRDEDIPFDEPLKEAAEHGHIEILNMLLGARPGQEDPIHQIRMLSLWALKERDFEVMAVAAENGAPSRDLLYHAIEDSRCDLHTLERILQCRKVLPRAFHLIRCFDPWLDLVKTCEKELEPVMELLFKHGWRPKSDKILFDLVMSNDVVTIQHLTSIERRLDLATYGHMGLFVAILSGDLELVKYLIEHGANPHLACKFIDSDEWFSAVYVAAQAGQVDTLKFLILQQQVRPDKKDFLKAGMTDSHAESMMLALFQYDDEQPERVKLPEYVAMMEELKGKPDVDFVAMEALPFEILRLDGLYSCMICGEHPGWCLIPNLVLYSLNMCQTY